MSYEILNLPETASKEAALKRYAEIRELMLAKRERWLAALDIYIDFVLGADLTDQQLAQLGVERHQLSFSSLSSKYDEIQQEHARYFNWLLDIQKTHPELVDSFYSSNPAAQRPEELYQEDAPKERMLHLAFLNEEESPADVNDKAVYDKDAKRQKLAERAAQPNLLEKLKSIYTQKKAFFEEQRQTFLKVLKTIEVGINNRLIRSLPIELQSEPRFSEEELASIKESETLQPEAADDYQRGLQQFTKMMQSMNVRENETMAEKRSEKVRVQERERSMRSEHYLELRQSYLRTGWTAYGEERAQYIEDRARFAKIEESFNIVTGETEGFSADCAVEDFKSDLRFAPAEVNVPDLVKSMGRGGFATVIQSRNPYYALREVAEIHQLGNDMNPASRMKLANTFDLLAKTEGPLIPPGSDYCKQAADSLRASAPEPKMFLAKAATAS